MVGIEALRARVGGMILSQAKLRAIHEQQKISGRMTTVEEQLNLRRTFLEKVAQNHPQDVPPLPYDLSSPQAQTTYLDRTTLEAYKIEQYLAAYERLAPMATAGLRETFDVLDWNNPDSMYNPIFTILLIEAEARFIREQSYAHKTKAELRRGNEQQVEAILELK